MSKTFSKQQPVVTILGHIDHGKSTLLDYIRKTDKVAKEAGSITQHIGAYEITHKTEGVDRKITFIDTPGHAAFSTMRSNALLAADIAVIVIATDDGVNEQTKEVIKIVQDSGIFYMVAFTKVDLPGANLEKAKLNALENGILLEHMGGSIPYVALSGKTGQGIDDFLDLLILMNDLHFNEIPLTEERYGIVIEADVDEKTGIGATIIVKEGVFEKGLYASTKKAFAPLRNISSFTGEEIAEGAVSHPLRIVGFNQLPEIGAKIILHKTKKDAQNFLKKNIEKNVNTQKPPTEQTDKLTPVVLKANVHGALDAIQNEIEALQLGLKIVKTGVGNVVESDVNHTSEKEGGLIIAFHTKVERDALHLAKRSGIEIGSFDTIYDCINWVKLHMEKNTPIEDICTGLAEVIHIFIVEKNYVVCGAELKEGQFCVRNQIQIKRGDKLIAKGMAKNIEQNKNKTECVEVKGTQFAIQIANCPPPAIGDSLCASTKKD